MYLLITYSLAHKLKTSLTHSRVSRVIHCTVYCVVVVIVAVAVAHQRWRVPPPLLVVSRLTQPLASSRLELTSARSVETATTRQRSWFVGLPNAATASSGVLVITLFFRFKFPVSQTLYSIIYYFIIKSQPSKITLRYCSVVFITETDWLVRLGVIVSVLLKSNPRHAYRTQYTW